MYHVEMITILALMSDSNALCIFHKIEHSAVVNLFKHMIFRQHRSVLYKMWLLFCTIVHIVA